VVHTHTAAICHRKLSCSLAPSPRRTYAGVLALDLVSNHTPSRLLLAELLLEDLELPHKSEVGAHHRPGGLQHRESLTEPETPRHHQVRRKERRRAALPGVAVHEDAAAPRESGGDKAADGVKVLSDVGVGAVVDINDEVLDGGLSLQERQRAE